MASNSEARASVFPRFTILLMVRLVLIIVNVLFFAWIFDDKGLLFNKIILGILFIGQVAELLHAVNQTNRELSRLLNAIRYNDITISFDSGSLGYSFRDLENSFAGLIHAFRQVKIEREAQYQFLQKLVNQMTVGIIALRNEEIELINPTAQSLLNSKGVTNWKLIRENNPQFAREISDLGDSGRKLLEISSQNITRSMTAEVSTITILGELHRLITIQDINSEIEQKEIEAWHKLIRILTHEIMNSVTPVSSLTETMESMLTDKSGERKPLSSINDETIDDILFSVRTVQRRSKGLLNFVENYRKITRVPRPVKTGVDVGSLIGSVQKLMLQDLAKREIQLTTDIPTELTVLADQGLVEQVLINLVTNSMHALDNVTGKRIDIKAFKSAGNIVIEVTDNGKGIPAKEMREIFVPFFTTRESGSGIGLSLSKEIMSAHGGSIRVESEPGQGSTFSLYFR